MSCPTHQALQGLLERTLDLPHARELETHVDACSTCRGLMHSLATGPTALGTPPPGSEPTAPRALADTVSLGDRYEVKHLLGRGGMGAVYLARDQTLGRDVAVKLHGAGSGDDRLQREAVAMAKLAHPNVVTVFEVASFEDRLYVAMEYVRGGTLRSWLAQQPRTWREKLAMLIDAGEGLAAAHAAELIHRDFKPENVLVGEDGRARVSDFGIAHLGTQTTEPILAIMPDSDVNTPMTVTGAVMGTPAYMSPEQLSGDPIDARADQFAFCVVAWEVLTGVRPFVGNSLAALAVSIERQVLERPAKVDVPQRVLDIIARGLVPDPDHRHRDLPALLAQLRAAAARNRGRWVVLGALGAAIPAAVLVTALTTSGARSAAADACSVDASELAGAWDPAVKDKLTSAFVAARPQDGAQIVGRVATLLDRYADGWIVARRQACEATRVRGEQSEAALELRMACLDRKRDELAALTKLFGEVDTKVALTSVRAALGLSPPAACADVRAMSAPISDSDQQQRVQVEAERAELAIARALRLLGRYEPALAKARAAAQKGVELKYRALEAEALLIVGDLEDRTGQAKAAVKSLEQAAVAANASNHQTVAVEAWSTLAWVLGTGERDFERATWAVQMASSALEALGGQPELAAQLLNYEALILEYEGKLPEARLKYQAALAAYEKLERDSWKIAILLNDFGGLERKSGNLDAAQELHERALAIRTKTFGEAHPFVFSSLNNLGTVAWSRGDYQAAETWFQKALACALEVFPEKHPQTALVLNNLGSVYNYRDRYDESVATYRRALAMYEALRGPTHPDVAYTLRELGNVLRENDHPEQAAPLFERALAIMGDKKDDAIRVKLLADYGGMLITKDPKRAEAMLREAVAIVEEESKTDPELGYSLTSLGELYAATKRTSLAEAAFDRALAIRTADKDTDAEDLAQTELSYAKLLWTTPADRPRARELAGGAKQRLEAAKATERKPYKLVTAWLDAHD